MSDETQNEVDGGAHEAIDMPLAIGGNGERIIVPENVSGWRVCWRKLGERGGSPSLVYANARPLILPIDATPDDLIEQVRGKAGKYRLDPVDETGCVIEGSVPAYTVIERDITPPPVAPAPSSGNAMEDLLRQLMQHDRDVMASNQAALRTLQDCLTIQSQQTASVLAAASQLVSPNTNRRIEVALPEPAPVERQGFDWGPLVQQVMPLFQMLGTWLGQKMFAQPSAPGALPPNGPGI